MAALDGLRILDLTQYEAGPSATQALAWLGADVVKVERPGIGDPGRGGGFVDAAYFHHWNANKRSVALNLADPAGRALLLDLVPRFDVFVENFGPGAIGRLGLDYAAVRERHPGVIYATVKGFGTFGPYAEFNCFDSVAQAMSGAFSVTGHDDGPPLPPGTTTGDSGTGMQLAVGLLAAYVQKLRTGEGQYLELSMQEAMTYYMRTRMAQGTDWGRRPAGRTDTGRGALVNLYACAPGGPNDHVYLMAITDTFWRALAEVIGGPGFADDPRFADAGARAANADELRAVIGAWCATRTKQEAMRTLASVGVPCGMVLDSAELLDDPHLVARGFVHEVDIDGRGPVRMLGFAPRLSASPIVFRPAPPLGAHTDEVLRDELGLDPTQLAASRAAGIIG
jgi:crotonobetainyl-CoA:carnitine CoA-transferase CaiB-like acyl-CoA transferase